jgi:hypothetical protein
MNRFCWQNQGIVLPLLTLQANADLLLQQVDIIPETDFHFNILTMNGCSIYRMGNFRTGKSSLPVHAALAGKALFGGKTVEIFKTDVQEIADAIALKGILHQHLPGCRVVFDLDDCDRILKIEGPEIAVDKVINLLRIHGFRCELLE